MTKTENKSNDAMVVWAAILCGLMAFLLLGCASVPQDKDCNVDPTALRYTNGVPTGAVYFCFPKNHKVLWKDGSVPPEAPKRALR